MNRTSSQFIALLAALALVVFAWTVTSRAQDKEHKHSDKEHKHTDRAGPEHLHAPVPADYSRQAPRDDIWTDKALIARGAAIYATKCAVCHGNDGGGDGPAVVGLTMKPASFRDRAMVAEMSPAYWFWRISEGGAVEPYKSKGSAMPAYKAELSPEDRWAVIVFQHSLSGHHGAHTPAEHAEMRGAARQHPEPR
jgi:mono/diheme cytochrome c family protein